ncbi:restriction endonuclease subunit S [Desertifilum sp. FACHB-1129]|uniref:Restriction endonuclease subunit S n=1 Tax=Desertifilum tharense IPPAS B-1220 TaxID=1781255 RepID=A0A1E5QIV0_9CYAN|nr:MULTISPECIES: hypothetical protein [Desertifilum]MDA0212563.1 restriction endonuclease subunit S [Cyanobacteria bacterium FC1]MBD2315058.1 restriction endonuclease subunit S [Desertifilum sp. FACHB-1129]MBD2324981.1 restriction endonuclease subunit S [Desertifilum sp. FACHB-866]MBD2335120.1 restriction endonuclease subunit S [Desertifilum sp. FACHB-868]OEJ74592.1 hypothetical protein BH720_13535 [Desertifilum tharense IPPAS B-1220]
MSVPPEIQLILDRLYQELDETEREAIVGLNLVRQRLSLFPENEILRQLFATLSNILFFVEIHRGRISYIIEQISYNDTPAQVLQEVGEDLGLILGRVLDAKMNVNQIKNRLED